MGERDRERKSERVRERESVLIAYYNRWSADAGLQTLRVNILVS